MEKDWAKKYERAKAKLKQEREKRRKCEAKLAEQTQIADDAAARLDEMERELAVLLGNAGILEPCAPVSEPESPSPTRKRKRSGGASSSSAAPQRSHKQTRDLTERRRIYHRAYSRAYASKRVTGNRLAASDLVDAFVASGIAHPSMGWEIEGFPPHQKGDVFVWPTDAPTFIPRTAMAECLGIHVKGGRHMYARIGVPCTTKGSRHTHGFYLFPRRNVCTTEAECSKRLAEFVREGVIHTTWTWDDHPEEGPFVWPEDRATSVPIFVLREHIGIFGYAIQWKKIIEQHIGGSLEGTDVIVRNKYLKTGRVGRLCLPPRAAVLASLAS
jgi:hypothetical protein